MGISGGMTELTEPGRRKPGAGGTPVILADGREWLLASPTYRACPGGLTHPPIDPALDRLFDCLVLHESLSLCDIWEIARALLSVNYDLSDEELNQLLSVAPGAESRRLAAAVLDATLGSERHARSYCHWVRASLLANGLGLTEISTSDLPNVLAILVATNRTVPASWFVDTCKEAHERSVLESLV